MCVAGDADVNMNMYDIRGRRARTPGKASQTDRSGSFYLRVRVGVFKIPDTVFAV